MTKVCAGLALLFVSSTASIAFAAPTAAERKECIAAFDQGQTSKTDHHLVQAQTQLLACTKETCPAVLRADCAEVLKSVEAALPSVVLAAEDNGKDVTDVKVSNGDAPLAPSLDAKAIPLDPGTYDFKFERNGQSVVVHFVLREGEKNREVRGIFSPPKPVVLPPPPPQLVRENRSAAGYAVPGVLAAGAVAGFVVAGLTRLEFNKDVNDFRTQCAPRCTEDSRAELSNTLVHANVALGIGIGALALAVVSWFVFTPGYEPAPAPTTAALTW